MRATSTAVILILAPFPRAGQPPPYRQVVDRYRSSPNDGVKRMVAPAPSARRDGIEQVTGRHKLVVKVKGRRVPVKARRGYQR